MLCSAGGWKEGSGGGREEGRVTEGGAGGAGRSRRRPSGGGALKCDATHFMNDTLHRVYHSFSSNLPLMADWLRACLPAARPPQKDTHLLPSPTSTLRSCDVSKHHACPLSHVT